MKINYSPFHRWYKQVVPSPEELFSKKNKKRILSTLGKEADNEISHEIKPLSEGFLDWFIPLYEQTIGEKDNAVIHNIRESTIENTSSESNYQSLTIKQGSEIMGGTIFGVREDRIMTAFKTYYNKWNSGTLQANPTLYSEYVLCKYAYEDGRDLISHGKDRNPYGLNASIGLATFKLSAGYKASILSTSEDYQKLEIETDEIDCDALILNFPENEDITKATLVTTKENEDKYNQLKSYPELLAIETVYRD